jgi:hypothetical protein
VDYADKDNNALRPAIGILDVDLANNTTGTAIIQGQIYGIDTSMWQVTDQLVLGNDGYLIRPPPYQNPFTGYIQNLGVVERVDASDGHIIVNLDGMTAVTAAQVFALVGTYGTPSSSNKYVTDSDPRLLAAGSYQYPKSATDPVYPIPQDGYLYFNTDLETMMQYDASRSKWLSIENLIFNAGRNGNTAAGSYYRGIDGITFGTNIGYPVPKGTLVGLSWTRSDPNPAILEVVVDTTPIATLFSSTSGLVANWSVNADFNQGLLKFRNQIGSNTTSNVQITAIVKRRV